eukprot:scaffold23297_cov132-Cylindrotheca_fusiformis.AAC.8
MARSKSRRRSEVEIDRKELDRFAGSSDEEEEDPKTSANEHDEDDKDSMSNSSIEGLVGKGKNQYPSDDDDEEEVVEAEVGLESSSAKMANAMARILGTTTHKTGVSSVVLSKTTTPLQRMQFKEKEQAKALREKRKVNRERNLTALHIPLSVATTNTIETGGQSVAKELENERLHRRVATRGVVALFNAITQHQKATEGDQTHSRQKDAPKETKHSFLDKIKNAASHAPGDQKTASKEKAKKTEIFKQTPKWDALKDDYLLNSKKNWDQESSEEDNESFAEEDSPSSAKKADQSSKKRRRIGNER